LKLVTALSFSVSSSRMQRWQRRAAHKLDDFPTAAGCLALPRLVRQPIVRWMVLPPCGTQRKGQRAKTGQGPTLASGSRGTRADRRVPRTALHRRLRRFTSSMPASRNGVSEEIGRGPAISTSRRLRSSDAAAPCAICRGCVTAASGRSANLVRRRQFAAFSKHEVAVHDSVGPSVFWDSLSPEVRQVLWECHIFLV